MCMHNNRIGRKTVHHGAGGDMKRKDNAAWVDTAWIIFIILDGGIFSFLLIRYTLYNQGFDSLVIAGFILVSAQLFTLLWRTQRG